MNQTSKEALEQLVGLVILGLIILGGVFLYAKIIVKPFVEVSGIVTYDDCREKIILNSADYAKQDGTFVCNDLKTNSGKSMGGQCIKVVNDDSGKCKTAYVYLKPADETCASESYLTANDKCLCDDGFVSENGVCISYDQSCVNSFGSNSHGGKTKDSNGYIISAFDDTCYCDAGYDWNSDRTACIVSSLYDF